MKLLMFILLFTYSSALASNCNVTVCNRIHRFSLSIWSHMKDSMGETCFDVVLPKDQAVVGHVLSSDSRWYQGSSINPTKESVTTVKKVNSCE
jgi:hypothetical protein